MANQGPPAARSATFAHGVIQGLFRSGWQHSPFPARQVPRIPVAGCAIQPRIATMHIGQPVARVDAVPLSPAVVGTLGAAGQRMPPVLQRHMEAHLGADLRDVRLHVGPQAPAIGAMAFAHGNDLYFAPGQYQPATAQGQHLLAHELTHVVQQRSGRVRNPFGQGIAIVRDAALESEANQVATRALAHGALVVQAKSTTSMPSAVPGRTDYPTQDIGRLHRKTGGKEKDVYLLEQGKAAAVSKTGDLRRIQEEVRTLHMLANHSVPTIQASDVMMFRVGDRTSPGFIVDWIPNTIDSNADPAGFRAALKRLRPEMRRAAAADLNKIERFVHHHGGIQDLQVLLEGSGRLRVLDPRGETEDTTSSLQLINGWRATLGG